MTDDVPITEAGRERATALARLLGEADVAAILVSDTVRTKQTAEPLATKLNLTPIVAPRNNVAGLAASVRNAVKPGKSLLVVRHSNEVPALVEALGGPKQPAMNDDEYSRLYVVTLADGKLTSVRTLRYGR